MRGGHIAETDVASTAPPSPGPNATAEITGDTTFAGTTVSVLTPPVAQDLGLPFDSKGVVVTAVAPGSPADQMGLQKGDIIVSIDRRQVTDAAAFKSLVSARADQWQIVIDRNGQTIRSIVGG